jgi:hypothetical protein
MLSRCLKFHAFIASWVPALGPTPMDETNAAVIARLDVPDLIGDDRATQYSRDRRVKPRSRGVLDRPVKPGDNSLVVAGVLPSPTFPGAIATKQSMPQQAERWIASLRSQ